MSPSPTAASRHPWRIVIVLVLGMSISFFDRGNLAVAAPVIAPELGLSAWSLGILLSAFFWTYSVSQIGAGWLVDRLDVRWVYAAGFTLWCMSTVGTAFTTTFYGLLAMRLLLGIGESVSYPATSHILAATFPESRRGLANSVVDLGARLGPALGTLCGGLLLAKVEWRGLFLVTGVGALFWLIPWLISAPAINAHHADSRAIQRPGWADLLSRRAVWGTVGGLCGANYAWYFLLSWLPSYLVRERGFSLGSMAVWGAMPYAIMAVSSITGGLLSDRGIASGKSPVRVRKGFLITGLLLTAGLLQTVLVPSVVVAIAGLLVTCLAFGIYASNVFSLTQTLAGPEASGRWTGLQNACGNLAGIASAMATGWIVNKTGHFYIAFVAASCACVAGAASFYFLVREGDSYAARHASTAREAARI